MADMLSHALAYARRGWSVVPARPRSKIPLASWAEFTKRQATEDEIRAWWKETPDANIALVTGAISGVVVVDVDKKRGGSAEQVQRTAPTLLQSHTGGGGAHLFYSHPGGFVDNRVGSNGVDIRADGGIIILPPSVHENGNQYRWAGSGGEEPAPLRIAVDQLSTRATSGEKSNALDLLRMPVKEHEGRNDAAARIAGYLFKRALPLDAVMAIAELWNHRNKPPLGTAELARTVRSVYRYHSEKISNDTEEAARPSHSTWLVDFDHYMTSFGSTAVTWIIDEWLPESTIAFVVAPPSSYKTWLLLDLAVSVASGGSFLGKYPLNGSPGPVIVIQQEDFHGQLAERFAAVACSKLGISADPSDLELPPSLPIYMHVQRSFRLDNEKSVESLRRSINELRPRLVIIDPLYSVAPVDDFMVKAASLLFVLKKLRDQYGCSFVVAHHTSKKKEDKKPGGLGSLREELWGSQFLNAFLETGWQIRQKSDTAISISRHFKVRQPPPRVDASFNIDTAGKTHYSVEIGESEGNGEPATLFELLEFLATPKSIAEIAAHVGKHRSTISRQLKAMVDSGQIVKTDDGKYGLPPNQGEVL